MLLRVLVFLAVVFLIDLYVFQAIRVVTRDVSYSKWIQLSYWGITVFTFIVLLTGVFYDWHNWPKIIRTYAFAMVVIFFLTKIFILLFLLIDDITRVFRWMFALVYEHFYDKPLGTPEEAGLKISRSNFLVKVGLVVAAIPFVALIFGMIHGATNYQVRRIKISFKNLPKSFHGFKIVQISDIHSGSFMSPDPLHRAVEIVNSLQPDIIFFTGDLVNDQHEEVLPHMESLSKLKAQHGIFSIFGNHDYGDYMKWPSKEAKIENLEKLKDVHRDLGWKLMLDEHTHIEKENERIGLIGIQNWSSHLRFPKYGSMEKATAGMDYAEVNILLSHDPSHWRAEVLEKYPQVDLMLAGHTHGFQFGVEIPGFKWSPVQYLYKEWADVYNEGEKKLYVNRGLGFLGYPGRVGILPEITFIELASG